MYDPDDSSTPFTMDEVLEAHHGDYGPDPKVGDAVYYRHHDHGDITEATVVAVQPMSEKDGDVNLTFATPWRLLTLDTMYGAVITRRARVRGSAGWLLLEDLT